jgi:hypothetical protein
MPIYFGFIVAFIAVVFLTNKKEKKWTKQKSTF